MFESFEAVNAYFGELPWAMATGKYLDSWYPASRLYNSEKSIDIEVYRTWGRYSWKGYIPPFIDHWSSRGIQACFPAPILFEAGELIWTPGTREWRHASNGTMVAQFLDWEDCEGDKHSALFVCEDWLNQTLEITGHSVVFGWLGEKQLTTISDITPKQLDRMEFEAVASLAAGNWTFGDLKTKTSRSSRN